MARRYTNFSEYSTGALPAEWVAYWNQTGATNTIETAAGSVGGKALQVVTDATSGQHRAVYWDAAGDDADISILAQFDFSNQAFSTSATPVGIGYRMSGSGATKTGWAVRLRPTAGTSELQLCKFNASNTPTLTNSVDLTVAQAGKHFVRVVVVGQSHKIKYWQGDLDDEPGGLGANSDWTHQHTDAEVTGAGKCGFYMNATSITAGNYLEQFAFDNDAAQMAAFAPVATLSDPTASGLSASGATIGITSNTTDGVLYWYVSASATPPSVADLKAGTGAVAGNFGNDPTPNAGANTAAATGLSASTTYYAYWYQEGSEYDTAISGPHSFATTSGYASPVLSSPTSASVTQNTAVIGCSTTSASGTLHAVITNSASAPTAAQIKAEQNNTGAPAIWAGINAALSVGANTLEATELQNGTTFYAYFVQNDGVSDSNVVSVTFTTQSPPQAKYSFTKIGKIFDCNDGAGQKIGAFHPSLHNTSGIADWPWCVTCIAGFPHQAGVMLYGAKTDPTNPADWETYDTAKARGAFAAWAARTGQTLPASNPVKNENSMESPWVIKAGSTWYLFAHWEDSGSDQPTVLYTATDAPLVWNIIANGDGGRVISEAVAPFDDQPIGEITAGNTGHRGYLKVVANPFPGVAYSYVAWGLCGGGTPSSYAMYGSNDLQTWAPITPYATVYDWASPTSNQNNYSALYRCPESIKDAGGGEYVMLGQRGGSSGVVEGYVGRDGITRTRKGITVVPLGGTGADDEKYIFTPATIEYGGDVIMVYGGYNSSAANTDDVNNSALMLAVGTYTATGPKGEPYAVPNHDKYTYKGEAGLPAWATLNGAGTLPSISGGAINWPNDNSAANLFGPAFNSTTVSWAEIYIKEAAQSAAAGSTPTFLKAVGFSTIGNSNTQVEGRSGSGARPMYWNIRTQNVARVTTGSRAPWSNYPAAWEHGIRWDIANKYVYWISGNRGMVNSGTNILNLASYPASTEAAVYPRIYCQNNGNSGGGLSIREIEIRISTTGAGVRPTIVTAAADATALTLTFSADCIGDGSGITVKDNGIAVAGSWSRPTLGTARFVRSSGSFAGPVTYDIGSTDLRSETDLVALANVTGAAASLDVGQGGGGGGSRSIVRSQVRANVAAQANTIANAA